MSETKEFQGKNLDEAIEAACNHFDMKRDKLEIEILSGGSSGIFGLVGVKKATVRAKPRGSFKSLAQEAEAQAAPARAPRPERQPRREAPESRPESEGAEAEAQAQPAASAEGQGEDQPRRERGRRGRGRRGRSEGGSSDRPADHPSGRPAEAQPERQPERQAKGPQGPRRERQPRREPAEARQPRAESQSAAHMDDEDNGAPQGIGHLDQELLAATALEVTRKLLEPLVETAQVEVSLLADRVSVRIEDPENSGLLIGREGQTLAAIQYLVNRLVSKRMEASVRVQIDAGDYRENQDERLRQIARHLADKAMQSGRTQSTRPMSSYHRRVVHLTLQDDEHVFTRSKGEGSMKRVLIMSKHKGKNGEALEDGGPEQDYAETSGQ